MSKEHCGAYGSTGVVAARGVHSRVGISELQPTRKPLSKEDDMAVSDSFTELRRQVEEADQSVKAAASQDKEALEAKLEEARRRADTRAAELRARGQEASEEADAHWQKIQSDWGSAQPANARANGRQEGVGQG